MEIEIKDIRKKDYEKAIQFAIKGMHFDWYLDNRFLLNAYGRYFWYLEINRATQIFAAYADSEFVGVLLAEIKGIGTALLNALEAKEIPPRVEYSLTEKGFSVVPILQSICQWSGAYHKEDTENVMPHCQKCDYNGGGR